MQLEAELLLILHMLQIWTNEYIPSKYSMVNRLGSV
jgi:hypothetical protein